MGGWCGGEERVGDCEDVWGKGEGDEGAGGGEGGGGWRAVDIWAVSVGVWVMGGGKVHGRESWEAVVRGILVGVPALVDVQDIVDVVGGLVGSLVLGTSRCRGY